MTLADMDHAGVCNLAGIGKGIAAADHGFEGKGNAFSALVLDSPAVNRTIDRAVRAEDPILSKTDMRDRPGRNATSMGETPDARDDHFISMNTVWKDRFQNAGPPKPGTEHPFGIDGDRLTLGHRAGVDPMRAEARKQAAIDGADLAAAATVIRDRTWVRVSLVSVAPECRRGAFTVTEGDAVTVIVAGLDEIEDLTHGFTMGNHGVAREVAPRATASVTFAAGQPGVCGFDGQWVCPARGPVTAP